VAAAANGAEKT